MNLFVIIGLVFLAKNLSKDRDERLRRRPMPNKGDSLAASRQNRSSMHKPGYVDDGVLSPEEAAATIMLLRRYQQMDSTAQQHMLQRMNARIVAQFNHLLNSTWSMDDTAVYDYLAQQGRQGRYTELGAYAQQNCS